VLPLASIMKVQRLLLWLAFVAGSVPIVPASKDVIQRASDNASGNATNKTLGNATGQRSGKAPGGASKLPETGSATTNASVPKANSSLLQNGTRANVSSITGTSSTPPVQPTSTKSSANVAAVDKTTKSAQSTAAILPTTTTVPARAPDLASCSDKPAFWKDVQGSSCLVYVAKRWCTPTGGYGGGWNRGVTFDSFKNDGFTALTACCGCGGGVRGSLSQSSSMWQVLKGSCTVDREDCLTSPNFPAYYGTSQSCKVFVNTNKVKPVSAVTFATEVKYDVLAINGQKYSGGNGPRGVIPRDVIVWTSDSIDRTQGWKLCPDRPKEPPPPRAGVTAAGRSKSSGTQADAAGDASGGSIKWIAALTGFAAAVTAVCAYRYFRRSQSNRNMDTAFDKTTYGRKANRDGL